MKLLGAVFSGLMCLFGVGDAVVTIIEERREKKEKENEKENLEEKEES